MFYSNKNECDKYRSKSSSNKSLNSFEVSQTEQFIFKTFSLKLSTPNVLLFLLRELFIHGSNHTNFFL